MSAELHNRGPARRSPAHVGGENVALIDLLDRLLAGGVVLAGDITLAVADIDLVYVGLRADLVGVVSGKARSDAAVIYLYAITEPSARVPPATGFDDAPLQMARSAGVAALYSTHQTVAPQPQPDALLRHEQVVEAAMRQGVILPARFGTTFTSGDALRAAVERAGDRLRSQLQRVQGCVELAVRVGLPDRPDPAPRDGRGYLEAKLAEGRELEAIRGETLAPLAELAVRARWDESRSEGNTIRASYLVREDLVERFADEVRRLADLYSNVWLSCTGPWPPYSFVELEETQ